MLEQILATLGIKGASKVGGTSAYKGYAVVTGDDGKIDSSLLPGTTTNIPKASEVTFEPYGNIVATDVQAALEGLDDSKFAINGLLAEIPTESKPEAFSNIKVDATTSESGVVVLATDLEAANGTGTGVINSIQASGVYLPKNGGIATAAISGPTPTSNAHYTTKLYVDNALSNVVLTTGATVSGIITVPTVSGGSGSTQIANKGYVDSQAALKLSLSGGTISGAVYAPDPSTSTQIATKGYVDSLSSSSGAGYLSLSGGTISGVVYAPTPTYDTQVVIKSYVDDADDTKLNLAGGNLTGAVTNTVIALPVTEGTTNTVDLDLSESNIFSLVLYCDATLNNPTNTSTGVYHLLIKNLGGFALTWGSNFKFAGGGTPTISVGADKVDIIKLMPSPFNTDIYTTLVQNF